MAAATEPTTRGKVLLHTSFGDLDIELWPQEAPKACRNFVQLCMEGYYDSTLFHRVAKDVFAQAGDPTGTGSGGDSVFATRFFPNELHPRLRFTHRGLVAMASMDGPNTNASQFFITLGATEWLDKQHTIFGKVTGDTIYNLLTLNSIEVDENDRPVYPPQVTSAEILDNPFDDIVPRADVLTAKARQASEASAKAAKAAAAKATAVKAVKNFSLLSFGDDAEEDERARETSGRKIELRSAHDVVNDPRLLKQEALDAAELQGEAMAKARKRRELETKAESVRQRVRAANATDAAAVASSNVAGAGAGSSGDGNGDAADGGDDDDDVDDDTFDMQMRARVLRQKRGTASETGVTSAASAAAQAKATADAEAARRAEEYKALKREVFGKGTTEAKPQARQLSALEALRAQYRNKHAGRGGEKSARQDWTLSKMRDFLGNVTTTSMQQQHVKRHGLQAVQEAEELRKVREANAATSPDEDDRARGRRGDGGRAAAAASSSAAAAAAAADDDVDRILPPELEPAEYDDDDVNVNDSSWRAKPLKFQNRVADPALRMQTDANMYEVLDPLAGARNVSDSRAHAKIQALNARGFESGRGGGRR